MTYEPKIDPELQAAFDARVREHLNMWWDAAEMAHGCAFCGSHEHPNRKCDAPPPDPSRVTGLIPWLEAQKNG